MASIDSIIKAGIGRTVTILATDGLQYRTSPTGTWASIVAKFHAEQPQVLGYDENHQAIVASATAHLKVPDGGTALGVAGPGQEWQIKTADGTVWAVVGVARHLGQTVYTLARNVPVSLGVARGDVQ